MGFLGCKACLVAFVQLAAISGSLASSAPHFIQEPSDTYVRKGKSAIIKCEVEGNPKPSITWKRNGIQVTLDSRRMIKQDGSLYFTEIIHNKTDKPDEGIYHCEAESSFESRDYQVISRSARVIIAGLSSKVSVIPPLLKVTFGDTARLFCDVKHSNPKAIIVWRKRGSNASITTGEHFTLIPDGALQIRNIRFEDQGDYECTATNDITGKTHISTNAGSVKVMPDNAFPRDPYFDTTPKHTVAIAKSKVVLECLANGYPKPRFTWLKDGLQISLGSQGYSMLGQGNLMIQSVSVSHAGTYTCRVSSRTRSIDATAKLDVHYGPVFTKKPRDVHAHAASSVRFECEAEGIPKPNISWSLNGRKLTNSGYINVGDGFLQVQDLVTSDTGVYQCFAKGNSGEFQASAQLFVYRAGEPLPVTTPSPTTPTKPTSRTSTTSQTTSKPVPERPENVDARALSDTEIELTWSPPLVPNGKILEYVCIYVQVSPGDAPAVNTVNISGDSFVKLFSNLEPDTEYQFSVFAKNQRGAGSISEEVIARTYSSSKVPGKPRDLVAEAETESSIRVTWAVPDTGPNSVSRYVITYKDTSSNAREMEDVTKQQTRVLRDLKTYTKYTITVFAENKAGLRGATAVTEATTKGGVPMVAPRDFALKPDSSGTGLIATWSAPDPLRVNGRITFYAIQYRKVGNREVKTTSGIEADQFAFTIIGLMPGITYEAKIAAGSDSGLGLYTHDWVQATTVATRCKEDTTPGKPKFGEINKFRNAILVRWLPPDNAGLVCVTGYTLWWGENAPYQFSSEPLTGDKRQYLIENLRPNQKYVIKLVANNSRGNGLDIQNIIQTVPDDKLEPVKAVSAIPLSSKVVRISWKDAKVSISAPVVYHVYHSQQNQLRYCGNTTEKFIKCIGLKPYTKYLFLVRRNDERINATAKNFTLEDKPGVPIYLTGNPNEEDFTRLTLQWQPPQELNGHILEYRIYYTKNVNASDGKWKSVDVIEHKLTKEISGLQSGTTYYFKMQARTKKGWGPLSKVTKIATLSDHPGTPGEVPAVLSTSTSDGGDAEAAAGAQTTGGLKNKTLWIVIAAVAGITLIAIIIISVILCKKRSGDDIQRKPPTYKQVIQSNGSAKKKQKEEKNPDLWINHTDNMEMKPVESVNPAPDVTNTTALIPRRPEEMQPLQDSPLDHLNIDNERSSFLNSGDADSDDFEDLPPPPMLDSEADPYLDYPDDNRTPTPPPSPGLPPFSPPRPITPVQVDRKPIYPVTSTPRYQPNLSRTGSCGNTLDMVDPRPPHRSRSYDPDFWIPNAKVPVYPMVHSIPTQSSTLPRPKPPVAPADDIQLPPVGYSRKTHPNGYWTPPPKYEDIFARRSKPPSSPPREQDTVVADLDKEIAGLEGLMRDLNEITAGDYII